MSLLNFIKKSSIDAKETNFISTKIYSIHIDKPLDLNFSEAAVSWLHNYKSIKQIESFKLFKIKNNISIPDNYFYIIYYCYVYVMPDILMLKNLLLQSHKDILNIGAGLAFHDIFVSQINTKINSFNIIEKAQLKHTDEFSGTSNKEKIINILELSKQNIMHNNLGKKFSFYDEFNYDLIKSKFDLIYSFRSWCYKYGIETYLEFASNALSSKGYLIVDIRNDFEKNKIFKKFNPAGILAEYKNHKRYILKN